LLYLAVSVPVLVSYLVVFVIPSRPSQPLLSSLHLVVVVVSHPPHPHVTTSFAHYQVVNAFVTSSLRVVVLILVVFSLVVPVPASNPSSSTSSSFSLVIPRCPHPSSTISIDYLHRPLYQPSSSFLLVLPLLAVLTVSTLSYFHYHITFVASTIGTIAYLPAYLHAYPSI